jgi:hypothetical protein
LLASAAMIAPAVKNVSAIRSRGFLPKEWESAACCLAKSVSKAQ